MLQKLRINLAASILSARPLGMSLDLWAIKQLDHWASIYQLEKYWLNRVRQIVLHAYQSVPYYRELLGRTGLDIQEIKTLSWERFRTIPILDKTVLREQEKELYMEGWETSDHLVATTSGSSGIPIRLLMDPRYVNSRVTTSNYYLKASGQKNIKKIANLWAVPALKSWGVFIDVAQYRDRWKELVLLLKKGGFESLGGPTSVLMELAEYMEKTNDRLELGSVWSGSEYLSAGLEHYLEKVFGCPIHNRYACAEVGIIAYRQKKCGFFHLNPASALVEIVDDAGLQVPNNQTGKVVVTGFENKIMPIIRYELGDLARVLREECSCGSRTPRIIFEGRDTYFLRLPDGKSYPVLSLLVGLFDVYYREYIKQVQIIQETIDKITLRIVPTELYTSQEKRALIRDILNYINCSQPITIAVETVSSIPRLSSNKTPVFISKIASVKK